MHGEWDPGPSIWKAHCLMKEADTLASTVSSTGSVLWQRFIEGTEERFWKVFPQEMTLRWSTLHRLQSQETHCSVTGCGLNCVSSTPRVKWGYTIYTHMAVVRGKHMHPPLSLEQNKQWFSLMKLYSFAIKIKSWRNLNKKKKTTTIPFGRSEQVSLNLSILLCSQLLISNCKFIMASG